MSLFKCVQEANLWLNFCRLWRPEFAQYLSTAHQHLSRNFQLHHSLVGGGGDFGGAPGRGGGRGVSPPPPLPPPPQPPALTPIQSFSPAAEVGEEKVGTLQQGSPSLEVDDGVSSAHSVE